MSSSNEPSPPPAVSYSQISEYSKRIEEKFGEHKGLRYEPWCEWHQLSKRNPLDPYDVTGEFDLVPSQAENAEEDEMQLGIKMKLLNHILEFGAGEGVNEEFMRLYCEKYTSVDSDPRVNADFLSLDELPENVKFDAVIAQEVFEHISKADIQHVVASISAVMENNAVVVATMPNVLNYCHFMKNYDHINPMKYNHLGAIFSLYGVEVVDAYLFESRQPRWDKVTAAYKDHPGFFGLCYEIFGMHPANQVAIVGLKRPSIDYRY